MAIAAMVWRTTLFMSASAWAPTLARADDVAEARRLFEKGIESLETGDLESARDLLGQSLALYPTTSTVFNLAGALVDLGEVRRAVDLYGDLLEGRFGELADEQRTQVETLRSEAERRLARVAIRGEGAARIELRLDGEPAGSVPSGATVVHLVDAGSHTVTGQAEGHETVEHEVRVASGDLAEITLRLTPIAKLELEPAQDTASGSDLGLLQAPAAAPSDERVRPSGGIPTWVFVAAGVLIAGAAVAAGLLLFADEEDQMSDPGFWGNTGT